MAEPGSWVLEITRSRGAMGLAVVGAGLIGIGGILVAIAFALKGSDGVGTSNDLLSAAAWLDAVAGMAVSLATSVAIWHTIVARQWSRMWEVAGANISTFIVAIGLLVAAATSPAGSLGANIVASIGFGAWAALLTIKAAQRALLERVSRAPRREAALWMVAALGVVIIAVAVGLPNAGVQDRGLALARSLLSMTALAIIAVTVAMAASRGLIVSRRYAEVCVGLWTLVIACGTFAIVAGVVFGPVPSLTGVRVGVGVTSIISALGFGLLGWAAWERLKDVALMTNGPPPFETGSPSQCGHQLPPGAHFCPQCGAPAYASSSSHDRATPQDGQELEY